MHDSLQEVSDFSSGRTNVRGGQLVDCDLADMRAEMDRFASGQPKLEDSAAVNLKKKYQANKDHTISWDNASWSAGIRLTKFVPMTPLKDLKITEERYFLDVEDLPDEIKAASLTIHTATKSQKQCIW